MMSPSIALVGLSCVYPDARSPAELWENVLAGRRAFRELPPERIRVEDYWSADRGAADRTYAVQAALIEGYEFDRVGFRVSGESFRAADLAHWLALDVAARALKDAGLEEGLDLPRDTHRRLSGKHAHGGILPCECVAAAMAVCAPGDRGGVARRRLVERAYPRLPGPARDSVQGAVSSRGRGDARRRSFQHHRGTNLQPLRLQGRRLHGRWRVCVLVVGGRSCLLGPGGRRPRRGAGGWSRPEHRSIRAGRFRQGRCPGFKLDARV